MQAFAKIQAATLAARARTGDNTIGTQLQRGRVQLVRVTYPAGQRGRSVVVPFSDWLTFEEAAEALGRLQA